MEWIIGGLIAAAVGTAMQTYAQQSANRKAQAKMNAAQYALGDAQDRINDKIMSAASEYESGKRETNQQAEAEHIAGDIKLTLPSLRLFEAAFFTISMMFWETVLKRSN